MRKSWFITFEGPDGSGKTTVSNMVYDRLVKEGYDVILTREPGGIEIAEQIRNVVLDPKNTAMDPKTEALLYAASRMQHLSERVLPALEEGKVVICDRFLDSSLAYQGYARGIGFDDVLRANSFALDYLPGLTVFIDVTPDVALKRLSGRDKTDRLDLEKNDFHQRVYEGYHEVMKMYPKRVVRVDGNQELECVVKDCIDVVLNYLK